MEGILLIDKPERFTSFDVIAKVRGMSRQRRIGHSGTLDPMATGVLPLFLGRAAKLVSLLPRQDKAYEGVFRLGLTTDTLDITGRVLQTRPVNVTPEQVIALCGAFQGEILQTPPMYSALKVDGQKLCDLAREGKTVARKPRPVQIHSISCTLLDKEQHLYRLKVHCGGGTYIRSLVEDIGGALGCGGVLMSLRRTMAAGFSVEQCCTLPKLQSLKDQGLLAERLLPFEAAFADLEAVCPGGKEAYLLSNGVCLEAGRVPFPHENVTVRMVDREGVFRGLLRYENNTVRTVFVMLPEK